MLNKRLRIYRPFTVHEYGRCYKKYSGSTIIFERTNIIRCYNCKWNEYFLQCSWYKLTFKLTFKCGKDWYFKYYDTELRTMCINLKNYVLKSIKI